MAECCGGPASGGRTLSALVMLRADCGVAGSKQRRVDVQRVHLSGLV